MSTKSYFDSSFSYEKSMHILEDLSCYLAASSDLLDLVHRRDIPNLLRYTIDYEGLDSETAFANRQILAFYSKNKSLKIETDPEAAAFNKFKEAESMCCETNRKILGGVSGEPFDRFSSVSLRHAVAREIDYILGPCPSLSELDFGFGPGANVGVSRLTSVRRKLATAPTLTTNAWALLEHLQDEFPHWDELANAKLVPGGKLTFVPKKVDCHRAIVVEPLINSFCQKGIGAYIGKKLRRHGCNLSDQSRNQFLARLGSIFDNLATIDMSMASDTLSFELVRDLLHPDWFELLYSARTPRVYYKGEPITLEKFSSMGNGCTFELESLIFYALARVVCAKGSTISVYGDDVIVETEYAQQLIAALNKFGFSVNTEKTFLSGPFRESCGSDFLRGDPIRPCYVKDLLSVKDLFRLHNFFVRRNMEGLAETLIKYIPKRFRTYGPDGFGDGHLLGDHCRTPHNRKRGWGGYTFESYASKPFKDETPLKADYGAFLYFCTGSRPEMSTQYTGSISEFRISEALYYERSQGWKRYRRSRIYTFG